MAAASGNAAPLLVADFRLALVGQTSSSPAVLNTLSVAALRRPFHPPVTVILLMPVHGCSYSSRDDAAPLHPGNRAAQCR